MPFVISKLYQLTHVWMNSSNGVHDIKNIRETYICYTQIYLLHTLQERPVIFKIVLLNKIIIALAMEKKHNRLPKNYFIWLVRMIIERPSMMTFYLIG